jgi:hypothetical protein
MKREEADMGSPSTPTPAPQLTDRRWQELCTHIRTTDDISFKLLGLVPLVSVAGIATSLLKAEPKFTPLVALLSLFAAAVTVALWIWERRNIQTCKWLRERAAKLEEPFCSASTPGHFFAFPKEPGGQGKTKAEKLVYGLTIASWLLLPAAVFASDSTARNSAFPCIGAGAYTLVAVWLGLQARRALLQKIDIEPNSPVRDHTSP